MMTYQFNASSEHISLIFINTYYYHTFAIAIVKQSVLRLLKLYSITHYIHTHKQTQNPGQLFITAIPIDHSKLLTYHKEPTLNNHTKTIILNNICMVHTHLYLHLITLTPWHFWSA